MNTITVLLWYIFVAYLPTFLGTPIYKLPRNLPIVILQISLFYFSKSEHIRHINNFRCIVDSNEFLLFCCYFYWNTLQLGPILSRGVSINEISLHNIVIYFRLSAYPHTFNTFIYLPNPSDNSLLFDHFDIKVLFYLRRV